MEVEVVKCLPKAIRFGDEMGGERRAVRRER
jgi:hypothetical protein